MTRAYLATAAAVLALALAVFSVVSIFSFTDRAVGAVRSGRLCFCKATVPRQGADQKGLEACFQALFVISMS